MPGFRIRTFFALFLPNSRMPTLSYFAGVPADLTPAIRSNRLAAPAGAVYAAA